MSLLLALVAAPSLAAPPCITPPAGRCATAALHRACEQPERIALPVPPPDHKPERDAGYDLQNQLLSENFALKWGSNPPGNFDEDDAQFLLDALEESWAVEIEQMGYPPPDGASEYLFNVYIGDSGGNSPPGLGNAGYYYYDDEGWPMVVLGPSVASDPRGHGAVTVAHEFFHAVQDAVDTYTYDGPGDWWHEATAVWMEDQVYPDDPASGAFFFGFALLPELPLYHFAYPSSGDTEEYHQYGAFIYVSHLAQTYDATLIHDSWVDAEYNDNPLDVIDELLNDRGEDEFFEFTARNATWDYPDRQQYLDNLVDYDWLDSNRPSGTLSHDDQWVEADENLPHTWGANYWQIEPTAEPVRIRMRPEFSDESEDAVWHAAVVTRTGDVHEVYDARNVLDVWRVDVADLDQVDEAWLVVSVVGEYSRTQPRTFTYEVRSGPVPEGPLACGCSSSAGGAAGWLVLPLFVALRRRRRAR